MKIGIYVQQEAIHSLAKIMADGKTWELVKLKVHEVQNEQLTGAEKRALVIKDLTDLGLVVGGWLLNLLLELAVAWLNLQAKR